MRLARRFPSSSREARCALSAVTPPDALCAVRAWRVGPFAAGVAGCGARLRDAAAPLMPELPLRAERRSAAVQQGRRLVLFLSHPSIGLSPELVFFRHYLVNLPHTSDFSCLDWGKKLLRVMFSSPSRGGAAIFPEPKSLPSRSVDDFPASSTSKVPALVQVSDVWRKMSHV